MSVFTKYRRYCVRSGIYALRPSAYIILKRLSTSISYSHAEILCLGLRISELVGDRAPKTWAHLDPHQLVSILVVLSIKRARSCEIYPMFAREVGCCYDIIRNLLQDCQNHIYDRVLLNRTAVPADNGPNKIHCCDKQERDCKICEKRLQMSYL